MSAHPTAANIRLLVADDAASYRALRLRALRDHPTSFGAALADEETQPLEHTARVLAAKTTEDFMAGAFLDNDLVGVIGMLRRDGEKRRHRATIFGMYVAPEARSKGIARALLDEATRRGRALDGLEEIMLAVAVGNDTARRLYLSAGFEPHYVDHHALKVGAAFVDLEWMLLTLR